MIRSPDVKPVVDALAGARLFRKLGADDLTAVARAGLTRRYAAGETVCHQGEPGELLYLLVDGLVKVVFTSERGDEMVLNTLERSEIFGELALLDGAPRSASVVALQPTSVFMLPRTRLLELMQRNPRLADEFLVMIGGLVRRLTEHAGDLAYLDLETRLAKLLLQLAQKHHPRDGVVLDGGLTQSDLAGMIGASRPAVNRALQSFAGKGLVEVRGRAIVLRDLDGLRKRSGL